MKCSKLHLQERSKPKTNKTSDDEPRRFCQKRMVNPEHEENPRWTDLYERFLCNNQYNGDLNEMNESERTHQEDLFLSVQNLQFEGSIEQTRRSRTSFKYKKIPYGQNHRMFVKQLVDDSYQEDGACSSILSDYGEDYAKYFIDNNQSRPSSSKSSIVLFSLNNKCKENKSVQVDLRNKEPRNKPRVNKVKNMRKDIIKSCDNLYNITDDNDTDNTKVCFRKNGKRKSLTIARTESPATLQVIRVDVVCNYSCSSTMSDYNDGRKESSTISDHDDKENLVVKPRKSHFVNKYMLTNSVKTLDENISGGKVTLMCKTYKLTDRTQALLSKTTKQAKSIIK